MILIQQHAQNILAADIGRVCQQERGPLLPQVAFQRIAHAQHAGCAVGHLQGNAHPRRHRQAGEQICILPGKTAQGLAGAVGVLIRHGAAADQRRRVQPHAAQNGAHCPGRALGKDRETPAAAGKQLQHIPHHLGQVAVCAQQKTVKVAEHQCGFQRSIHTVSLLSVARKWVK